METTYESIAIPLETEKKNMTQIDIKPVCDSLESVEDMYGKIFSSSKKLDEKIIFDYKDHPVYQGYLDAYKNHRPITISPDIIWLLIVQGFSYHVCGHADELRHMFVNFGGQKELTVERLDLNVFEATAEDWMTIFPSFVEQITEFTGKNITDTLTPDFTTTTQVSLAVGQISIMSALKHYFKYKVLMGGCGLPYVTIEGSVEDWQKIKQKLEDLKKYKLEFWIEKVAPIINKIIETKKGNVDREFWLQMIKIKDDNGFYDPGYVDGWFTNFFPYDDNGGYTNGKIFTKTQMPSEMLTVPFDLKILDHPGQDESKIEPIKCEFLAGFVGMKQDEKTLSMKSEIGWIIRKEPENKNVYGRRKPNGWNQ